MLNFLSQNVLELTNPILASFENHPNMVKAAVLSVVSDLLRLSVRNGRDENVRLTIIVWRNEFCDFFLYLSSGEL